MISKGQEYSFFRKIIKREERKICIMDIEDRRASEVSNFYFLCSFIKKRLYFEDLKGQYWIAGGALRSALVKDRINDIDIFTNSSENLNKIAKNLDIEGHVKTFENDWVINYLVPYRFKKYKVQLIKKYYHDNVSYLLESFDFSIVKAAFEIYDDIFVAYDKDFFVDNSQKRLRVNFSKQSVFNTKTENFENIEIRLQKPLSTLKRAFKYVGRGYSICPMTMSKIIKDITALNIDWNNPDQNQIDFYPDGTPTFRGYD